MLTASGKFLSAFLLCAVFIFPAIAQDITKGSISGVVRDPSGAVIAGTTVNLDSPNGKRTATTDSGGAYSFLNLIPGSDYTISVNQPGFVSQKIGNVAVAVNRRTTADVTLEVGQTSDTISVEGGAAEAIDLSSTSVGAVLDNSLYSNTAIGRNISSVISMAPGVADSGGAGFANPSINGASGLENSYVINGSNITDPGFGGFGSYSRNFGPKGSGVNFDFIQEVQVQSGGFEAEYGQALGGVINVITKSGTNNFHGSVYGYFGPASLQVDEKNPNPLLTTKTTYEKDTSTYDFGGDLGGYLVKNKLFFYGGINPIYNNFYRAADPSFANASLGVVNVAATTLNYTAKLNWNISPKHQLEGSVFGDPASTPTTYNRGLNSSNDLRESKLEYGSRTWTGRYTGTLTNSWIVTANYSEYSNHFTEKPKYNGYEITDNTPTQEGTGSNFTYNGLGFLENTETHAHQFAVSTSLIGSLFGQHTLQFGYQFEDDPYNDLQFYTGGDFTLPDDPSLGPAAGQTLHGAQFYRTHEDPNDLSTPIVLNIVRGNYSSPTIATDSRYNAGYIEDTWTIGNRLTLKPGIRLEQQAMNGTGARYVFAHNWAPRIGVIFDPTGHRKSKFFANWGRFFEKIPLDIAVRSLTVESGLSDGVWYRDPGPNTPPDLSASAFVPGGSAQVTGAVPTIIQGGTGAEYQDEVVGGFEHQFSDRFSFSGRFVYRHLRRIIEDEQGVNSTQGYDAGDYGFDVPYVVGNPNKSQDIFGNQVPCSAPNGATCVDGWTPPTYGADGVADGFPNPSRIYKSMELVVSRRFSTNFQFYGSYVLSKLYGNYQGSFRSDNGQTDPNISSLFDFTNTDGMLTYQYQPGVLPTDRRHQLKLYGNYQWRGFNFGLAWNIQSGSPLTQLLDHPVYQNDGEVPAGPRGGAGRTDWYFPLDLHGDYTIKLGEQKRLKFAADLFNVGSRVFPYRVNQNYEVDGSPGQLNPDYLKPYYDLQFGIQGYSMPFSARLAARFEF